MSELKNKKRSGLSRFFVGNSYCWAACLCTVGIMLLVYYCYDLFPFGDTTILRMDLYHQYGPLFAELYDRVTGLKSLIYSWQTGLGSPFLGNYFNYLSSPSAIIMLLLGHENMPEAIAGMIITKAALAAAAFTYYLKKSQGRHDFITAAFGVLYAMCGYFVAYYWNVMWIDAMVYFPLVILGIENIINRRSAKVYIPFLALTLLSNYYMGYMTCIFSVLYFIAYYLGKYDFTAVDPKAPFTYDENGKKVIKGKDKLKNSIFLKSGFTFAFSSIAAACLVAFSLIPTYVILKSCSATSGTMPHDFKSYYDIFDFLANHLASVNPTIRSSGDDVLPNVYCGIATLMLVPLYLFTHSVPLKEKIANVGLLGVLYLSFNINILNYIWHGFHYPNDLPYRFSFMYSFILLVMAYKAFIRLKEFTGRQILGAGVALLGAIILIQKIGSKNVEDITIIISIIFTVTYCLVFFLMKEERYQRSAVAVLLLCCVIGEIACSNTDRYSMSQTKENFVGDYAEFRELKDELDEYDGGDEYRMELTSNRARMDPAWFGYNGISTFSSMAYEKLSNVQSDLGICGNYINSYTYNLQTPVYNMMHSLKYIVNNSEDVTMTSDYYNELMTSGKFTAYENKYWLPMGMAVNSEIKQWATDYNNPFTVQSDWFEYATGVSDVYSMMEISNVLYYNMDEITSGLETGDIYFNKTGSGRGELTFILTVPETKHCYLYVDSSSFDSISISKGDFSYTQSTDEPYIYDLGTVTPEDTVSVLVTVEDSEYGYIDFYPYYVNDEALNEGYEILSRGKLNVTSMSDTKITGTVEAEKDCVFYSSIPYDKGWTVKIDGVKIDEEDYISLAEAYLCFELPAGEHTIELSFRQRGLAEGAAISALTLIILIAVSVYSSRRKKKLALASAEAEKNASVQITEEELNKIIDEVFGEIDEDVEPSEEETEGEKEPPEEVTTEAEDEQSETDTADGEISEDSADEITTEEVDDNEAVQENSQENAQESTEE